MGFLAHIEDSVHLRLGHGRLGPELKHMHHAGDDTYRQYGVDVDDFYRIVVRIP
jgi:hypothetical protein